MLNEQQKKKLADLTQKINKQKAAMFKICLSNKATVDKTIEVYQEAIIEMDQLRNLCPGHSQDLSDLLINQKKLQNAVKILKELLETYPNEALVTMPKALNPKGEVFSLDS